MTQTPSEQVDRIMRLMEQGKLSLDDAITKWFPD